MNSQKKWLVLVIVSAALLLITVDGTILFVALPTLTQDLQATATQKLWIINIYTLILAGMLPNMGTLGDKLGHRKLFCIGQLIFAVASLIAAFAGSAHGLIFARAILAVGAAFMMPATLAVIRITFTDARQRAVAFGVWSAISAAGAALGPVIGGVLLEHFHWGVVFLVNIPFIIAILPLTLYFVDETPKYATKKWDISSALLVMSGLILVVYSIKAISSVNPHIIAFIVSLTLGVALLYRFVKKQSTLHEPIIDFALFKNVTFTTGFMVALIGTFAMVGVDLIITQRLQLYDGLSPMRAGLTTIPIPVASFIAGPLAGYLLSRFGILRVLSVFLVFAVIGLTMCLYAYTVDRAFLLPSFALIGFGVGGFMPAASNAVMMSAPAKSAGMAASIEEVSYELGASIGIAIMGSLMTLIYSIKMVIPEGIHVPERVRNSLDEALLFSHQLDSAESEMLLSNAYSAFHSASVFVFIFVIIILIALSIYVYIARKHLILSK